MSIADRTELDTWDDRWMYAQHVALMADPEAVYSSVHSTLDTLSRGYSESIVCFTSTPNFRHECLPSYKGGRIAKRKPLCYWGTIEKLMENFDCRKIPNLEADDVMSIIATNPKYTRQYDITIFSQDKDMYQVPGVTLIRGEEVTKPSLTEANAFRYLQCLTGDVTDGYKGLKGYGPVKAQRYLDTVIEQAVDEQVLIDHVVSAYLDAGVSLSDAHAQMNCARILRTSEYDFKTKQPLLLGD